MPEKVTEGMTPAMETIPPEAVEPAPSDAAAELAKKVAEIEASYKNLQAEYGRQSNEVGQLRQAYTQLQSEIPKVVEQAKASATQTPVDYQQVLADINQKFEAGEITVSQALAETARITSEFATKKAESVSQEYITKALNERDNAEVKKAFLSQHKDFQSVVESGVLEPIKADNPLMNNVAAYFAFKATQEYERGKAEMAALQKGTQVAASVLGKPGADVSKPNKPKPTNDAELEASMLAALEAARQKESG